MKYLTILLFGPPGAGKGTWGNILTQIPGMYHFASGDMFRALDPNSESGKMVLECISRGELVPDEQAMALWREQMKRLVEFGDFKIDEHYLVLDGLPRTQHQAEMAEDDLEVRMILFLDCQDRDILVKRLYGRALIEHRHDDANEETIRHRFEVYDQRVQDTLTYYPKHSIRMIDVSQSAQKILLDISRSLVEGLGK